MTFAKSSKSVQSWQTALMAMQMLSCLLLARVACFHDCCQGWTTGLPCEWLKSQLKWLFFCILPLNIYLLEISLVLWWDQLDKPGKGGTLRLFNQRSVSMESDIMSPTQQCTFNWRFREFFLSPLAIKKWHSSYDVKKTTILKQRAGLGEVDADVLLRSPMSVNFVLRVRKFVSK